MRLYDRKTRKEVAPPALAEVGAVGPVARSADRGCNHLGGRVVAFLKKPFDDETLLEAVATVAE
jgi:hypothetical protein